MRVKCLVVDDREENVLVLSKLLESDDVEVVTARSGIEALDRLLEHDVALALLDVQMPEMDGFELAELMRGREQTRQVPIIFVTAGAHDQRRVFAGYELGAVDFLYKPIESHILRNKAAVFFELYRHRQRLAQELHARTETLRLAEMFTAVLGHDLRNPLHAMLTGARLLSTHGGSDLAVRMGARMEASALRMSRLVDDMLDLARARLAGGIPVRLDDTDLSVVVERVIEECRIAEPDRRVELTTAEDTRGEWDEQRLGQLASNLVTNALHHGDAGGVVRVRVDGSAATRVVLEVMNDGEIPADRATSLFGPFTQGPREHDRGAGLGLGLYIVQQIALAHRGRVDVQSGEGATRFIVTLPRSSGMPTETATGAGPGASAEPVPPVAVRSA